MGINKTSYDHHKITTTMESTLKQQIVSTLFATSLRNFGLFFIKLLRLFLSYRVGINKTSHDHHKITTTMENTLKQQIVSTLFATSLKKFGWLFMNVLTIIFKLQGGYL